MKDLYEDNNIVKIQFKKRCNIAICITLSIISLAACILLTVFVTHDNKTVMLAVTCVVAVTGGWFIIADIMLAILPYKYLLRHIEAVRSYVKVTDCGQVDGIKYLTVNKWLSAYEVTITENGVKNIFLWNTAAGRLSIKVGDKVKIVSASRFIISCEVVDE